MPDLYNVIFDIEYGHYTRSELINYEVRFRGGDRWDLYVKTLDSTRRGKIEFIIRCDGEKNDVTGRIVRNGDIGLDEMKLLKIRIMERL